MVTWIVLAVLGLALLVLVLAVRPVLSRLSALSRAARRLHGHAHHAQTLQARAAELEATLTALAERSAVTEQRLGSLRAGSDDDRPWLLRR